MLPTVFQAILESPQKYVLVSDVLINLSPHQYRILAAHISIRLFIKVYFKSKMSGKCVSRRAQSIAMVCEAFD